MRFAEECQIVPLIIPVDLDDGANASDWVSMKNYNHLSIIILAGIGTNGSDLVITLDQATTVAGAGTKTLNMTEIHHKVGATALNAVSLFTRVTQTAANGYDTDGIDDAENESMYIIEVDRDELDGDNDFDCLQLNIAKAGATKLGGAIAVLSEPRYNGADAVGD